MIPLQIIDEVQDICELEHWELLGHSTFRTVDGLCYYIYMYTPKYNPSEDYLTRTWLNCMDLLDPNVSSEPEASNDSDGVHNQCNSIETYALERSNQHSMVTEDEGSNLSSNFINHVAEDAIPKEPLHIKKVPIEGNGPKDNNRVQDLYSFNEQDDESWNSILTNYDETVPIERSNQHNMVVAA
ncbi:hypothetical protein PTKIN_Ptkin12aG0106700 [Pterospermum kingtungense]